MSALTLKVIAWLNLLFVVFATARFLAGEDVPLYPALLNGISAGYTLHIMFDRDGKDSL